MAGKAEQLPAGEDTEGAGTCWKGAEVRLFQFHLPPAVLWSLCRPEQPHAGQLASEGLALQAWEQAGELTRPALPGAGSQTH